MFRAPFLAPGEQSKDITKGIGSTCLIFAVSVYLPIIGFFFSLLTPLPILYYRLKLGRNAGTIISIVALLLMMVVLGGISPNALFFSGLILIGFFLAEFIEMNLSVEKTILYASSIVLLFAATGVILYSIISSKGPVAIISGYVEKSMELTMYLYENIGIEEDLLYKISNSLEKIQFLLIRIIPALFVVFTIFVSWTTLLLVRPILKGANLFFPDFGSLNLWKAPEKLVWGVIGCGFLLLLPNQSVRILGLNCVIILMMIYFFQGIAIVSYYFEKKQFPKPLKFFMYSFIALQQIIILIVIGLGFFDMWLDFRKLELKESE